MNIRRTPKKRKFYNSVPLLFFLSLASLSIVDGNAHLITGRPPSFVDFDPPKVVVPEGESIDLTCPVLVDDFDFEWFKDGEPLHKQGSKLHLSTVSRIDSGDYQCYASNGIGGAFSPNVNVTVLCEFMSLNLMKIH